MADDESVSGEEAALEFEGPPLTNDVVVRHVDRLRDALAKGDMLQVETMLQHASMPNPSPNLSQDHLLRLMAYNVFRGIITNKSVLSVSARHLALLPSGPTVVDIMSVTPGHKVVSHGTTSVPKGLMPTPLQNRVPHPTWIDIVPFAEVRETLIIHQREFDHYDFVRDAVGEAMGWMVNEATEDCGIPAGTPAGMPYTYLSKAYDDSITASHSGFILWGEPHVPASWEATPNFLRKWGWTVRGCPELIRATNKWRAERGEREIPFARFHSP